MRNEASQDRHLQVLAELQNLIAHEITFKAKLP
jgi:hypothetical protein